MFSLSLPPPLLLFKPQYARITNTDRKKPNRKLGHLRRRRNWSACVGTGTGIHVDFEGFFFFFFFFARAYRFAY